MYRPLSPDKVNEIQTLYKELEHLREELRSEETLRLIIASECAVSPFDVDRVLDGGLKADYRFKSKGVYHTLPPEKIRRLL